VLFRKKSSDFAVLASDDIDLELVEWHPPGARAGASLLALGFLRIPGAGNPLGTRAEAPAQC